MKIIFYNNFNLFIYFLLTFCYNDFDNEKIGVSNMGKRGPKTNLIKTGQFVGFHIDKAMVAKLDDLAQERDMSRGALLRLIVKVGYNYLKGIKQGGYGKG